MSEARMLRWRLWSWVSNRRGVCPANAHARIVLGDREASVRIDWVCRGDQARNGACWCGKLRHDASDNGGGER